MQAKAALSSCSHAAAASPLQQAARPLRPGSSSRRGRSVVVQAAKDYYDVLGIPRNADKKQIKQAYRQKARKFHPVSCRFQKMGFAASDGCVPTAAWGGRQQVLGRDTGCHVHELPNDAETQKQQSPMLQALPACMRALWGPESVRCICRCWGVWTASLLTA